MNNRNSDGINYVKSSQIKSNQCVGYFFYLGQSMLKGNIRLYLRVLYKIFYVDNFQETIRHFFHQPLLIGAQRRLNAGVLPIVPAKVLIKDLNQVDLKFYTYHSARNILKKHKVL